MSKKPSILISGHGIGGMAAALEIQLTEQAPALREAGAGVPISANGMAVLEELGVASRLLERAAHPEQCPIRMWNAGQRWTAFNLSAMSARTYGHPHVTVYRPDPLIALAEGVCAVAPLPTTSTP